jgi:hypothetical protein
MSDPGNYRERGLALRRELSRHHLSDRERRLAEVVLDASLGWGRESVVIPKLRFFSSLTGIAVPHVHEGIQDLHNMRILRVVTVKGQLRYNLREDFDNWKVKPRVSAQTIREAESLLRELNDLPPLREGSLLDGAGGTEESSAEAVNPRDLLPE